jgi:hypothetical protein
VQIFVDSLLMGSGKARARRSPALPGGRIRADLLTREQAPWQPSCALRAKESEPDRQLALGLTCPACCQEQENAEGTEWRGEGGGFGRPWPGRGVSIGGPGSAGCAPLGRGCDFGPCGAGRACTIGRHSALAGRFPGALAFSLFDGCSRRNYSILS